MLHVEVSQEINQFLRWLREAKPGGSYMYHRGLLHTDRQRTYYELTPGKDGHPGRRPVTVYVEPIHTLGLLAYGAAATGLVYLLQHRRGEGEYVYVAKRSAVAGDSTHPTLIAAARTAMIQAA